MIALGNCLAMLRVLNTGMLLQTAMIDFNLPSSGGIVGALLGGKTQIIGGPVFNVVFCNHYLEDLDKAKSFQMDDGAGRREQDRSQRLITASVGIDQAVSRLTRFRFSKPAYQLSKQTHWGRNPRS